jgi:Protein of unknown function (DUF3795)
MSADEIKDESLITYCGLYCGDCHAFKGKISDLALELRKELRRTQYDKFAEYIQKYDSGKELKHFDNTYTALGAMIRFRCQQGCRAGGGTANCKIKECCTNAKFEGCWECSEMEKCPKLDILKPTHGKANKNNLKILRTRGKAAFLRGHREW